MRAAIFEATMERLVVFSGKCAIPGRFISLGLIRCVAPLGMMSSVLRLGLASAVADGDATVLAFLLLSSLVVDLRTFSLLLLLAAVARASRLLVFGSVRVVGPPMSIVSDVWLIVKRFVNMGTLLD